MEHLAKLSKAGVLTYDPATHGVALNYASGRICQKDLDMGDTPKAHVYFEDPMTKGQKAKTKEEEELMAYYSFSGNTVGTVTFPVPFRYYVRMEFDMGIGTMDSHGTWGTLVMYDKRRGSGYLSEWLRVGTLQGGARKLKEAPNVVTPEGKPVRGSADVWHLKFRAVPYLVEYRMPDPNPKKAAEGPLASGQFSVIYDNYTAEPIPAKTSSKAFQRGLVGFTWNRTKFQIKNLQITGILDKEAAVAYLRELTKIKKSVAKKTTKKKPKAPAAEGETGEGGGNGGGTGDTAEKPKKKKAKSDTGEEGKKEDPFDF
jgi:hypothetical protein